ncbi:MAG TPA: hypothetical protein VFE12_08930, partial [Acetobacteraceae bacterium]|nr:hypothetical protein [Acetobacteraceae bacterium]
MRNAQSRQVAADLPEGGLQRGGVRTVEVVAGRRGAALEQAYRCAVRVVEQNRIDDDWFLMVVHIVDIRLFSVVVALLVGRPR